MTEKQVRAWLDSHEWKYAKTMPQNPHYYLHIDKARSSEEFAEVVEFIQRNGVPERFFRSTYYYFYHAGYKFWTMGYAPEATTIINKAKDDLQY